MISLFVAAVAMISAGEAPVFDAAVIFPGEAKHSHGSSLAEAPNGDLIAAWFYGVAEKGDDTALINGARLKKGATAWSKPFLMADTQDLPDQNPVLFVDPKNTLWMFWICTQDNTYNTYLVKYRTSTKYDGDGAPIWDWQDIIHVRPKELDKLFTADVKAHPKDYEGNAETHKKYATWLEDALKAAPVKLAQRQGWMTRIHPIMTSDTRMLLPLYSDEFACSLAAATENGGKTWTFGEPILNLNVQACFVQKKTGDIVAYMRDRGADRKIPRAVSKDGGMTWSHTERTDVPNPDSSVDCIALKSGRWVMVCNDTTGGPRGGRNQLSAWLSDDEGATWKWKRSLEKHGEECAASYPCVIQTKDGLIHCTYTYSPTPNETIKHAKFNEEWIMQGGSN